jgi:hypothetical protein
MTRTTQAASTTRRVARRGDCGLEGRDGGVDLVAAAVRRGGAMRSRRGEAGLRASGVGDSGVDLAAGGASGERRARFRGGAMCGGAVEQRGWGRDANGRTNSLWTPTVES